MKKTAKAVLVRLSPEEQKMCDSLLAHYLESGFVLSPQDLVRKSLRAESAKVTGTAYGRSK